MPGNPVRAGRQPYNALIIYDSLEPDLFRENLERISDGCAGEFACRNKVDCVESYTVHVENDWADRRGW
jgi:hypothetical protein